jgi:L,D-transpeptidase catalytic domain
MNLPKLFMLVTFVLFAVVGVMALFKGNNNNSETVTVDLSQPIEVAFEEEVRSATTPLNQGTENITEIIQGDEFSKMAKEDQDAKLPQADKIEDFFRKVDPRVSIVETITYKSKVPWLKGRPAWISDYASHYKTSRHFIARSLNGKKNYLKQDVALGDRFNVFKKDKDVDFYLVVDIARSKMWFYYHDKTENERVLLKSYDVGLGRMDSMQPSGLLTPLGQYSLGEKIAIYKPKQKGWFNNEKVEMIRVFGTRWIPFDCEIQDCTAPAKGFGIHGAPWVENDKGELAEDTSCIGKYESDGCVRLKSDDIEELFSIVISKPTYIVLVKDFFDAQLPGLVKE